MPASQELPIPELGRPLWATVAAEGFLIFFFGQYISVAYIYTSSYYSTGTVVLVLYERVGIKARAHSLASTSA